MSPNVIQDILPLVHTPSRYLGNEIHRILKPWEAVDLRLVLAFPDLYEIASSHFGIQILYGLLNAQEDILAERVYAPDLDMEEQLRHQGVPLSALESGKPVNQFDMVGFSLLYELNYTNMINMLDLARIPLYARARSSGDPLVIAGGPCTCNPEPIADFFDAIVVGDGESVILEMVQVWKRWRKSGDEDRSGLLRLWAGIPGVYIPSLFRVAEGTDGIVRSIPLEGLSAPVQRAVVSDLNEAFFPSRPVIPFGRPVHDRLRMEIARGCTRGCRFCQAGMIYRPVRERHPQKVLSAVFQALGETGYEDLSLLSLSTGDYGCITSLLNHIMTFGERDRVAVSLPSLRAGTLTPAVMEQIRKVRKTGFTIAPEAGSQRLRDVINKNITEADIVGTVQQAFALGWKVIKLYFMIGLPTETQADIEAIVALVQQLRSIARQHGGARRLNVSVATFVPKPHTPFQWEPQISLEGATEKLNWLKTHLDLPGVQLKWQDPRVSVVEGVWARGNRRLSRVLVRAWENGCRFDGWSDHFDYRRWMTVFHASGIDPETCNQGFSDLEALLPWDHIRTGVTRTFLVHERNKALEGKLTSDCRTGSCSGCGVCDFKRLQPVCFENTLGDPSPRVSTDGDPPPDHPVIYRISFKKEHLSRFLGHLEMVQVFYRAMRRANLPLVYSRGFHPLPRIAFGDPLPTGMESDAEWLRVTLTDAMDPQALAVRLQRQLPSGLTLTGCRLDPQRRFSNRETQQVYRVQLIDGLFAQNDLEWFDKQPTIKIERTNKTGKTTAIDLKKAVPRIERVDERLVFMTLGTDGGLTVRPAQVLKTVFHLTERQILLARITKQKTDHA